MIPIIHIEKNRCHNQVSSEKLHTINACNYSVLTVIGQWCGYTRIAIAGHKRFNTVMINTTLTNVYATVTARPKIPRISGSIIPPGICDTIDLKRCEITIVLQSIKAERIK